VRTIKRTAQFRRDFRRVKRSEHSGHVDATLLTALELLAADVPLPRRYVDHAMKGQYDDRWFHVVPGRRRLMDELPENLQRKSL